VEESLSEMELGIGGQIEHVQDPFIVQVRIVSREVVKTSLRRDHTIEHGVLVVLDLLLTFRGVLAGVACERCGVGLYTAGLCLFADGRDYDCLLNVVVFGVVFVRGFVLGPHCLYLLRVVEVEIAVSHKILLICLIPFLPYSYFVTILPLP
jgi:hypothetical protein